MKKTKGSFWDRFKKRDEREFVVDLPVEEVLALLHLFQNDWEFRRLFNEDRSFFEMNVLTLGNSYIVEMNNKVTLNLSTHDTTKTLVYLSRQNNRGCEVAIAATVMIVACPTVIFLCANLGFVLVFASTNVIGLFFFLVAVYFMDINPNNKRQFHDFIDALEAMLHRYERVPLPKRK